MWVVFQNILYKHLGRNNPLQNKQFLHRKPRLQSTYTIKYTGCINSKPKPDFHHNFNTNEEILANFPTD